MDMFDKVACCSLLSCFTIGLFKHAFVRLQVIASLIATFLVVQFNVAPLELVDKGILRGTLLVIESVVSDAKVWAFQSNLMLHLL